MILSGGKWVKMRIDTLSLNLVEQFYAIELVVCSGFYIPTVEQRTNMMQGWWSIISI